MEPYRHEIRYYECDGMGITHHSNYIRIMEEARIDWLDRRGCGYDRMEAEGIVSPVVSLSCNYKSPTRFKDVVSVDIRPVHTEGLKFVFEYTMKVGDRVVCTATSTHCFMENGRPIVITERYPGLV